MSDMLHTKYVDLSIQSTENGCEVLDAFASIWGFNSPEQYGAPSCHIDLIYRGNVKVGNGIQLRLTAEQAMQLSKELRKVAKFLKA